MNYTHFKLSIILVFCIQNLFSQEALQINNEHNLTDLLVTDISGTTLSMKGEVRDGIIFIEGDIALGTEKEIKDNKKGAVLIGSYFRWPNSEMPYLIAANHPREADILRAIQIVNEETNLCLIPRTDESNYVKFIAGSGCWSYLGRIGGEQGINISNGCSFGSIIHEIFHAAGMYHEQSRLDRDEFINIVWDNIQSGREGNFKKYQHGQDLGAYDYNSIMHYGRYAFSKNQQPTIEIIGPGAINKNVIGQRQGPSQTDLATINEMYPNPCGSAPSPYCEGLTTISTASGTIRDGSGPEMTVGGSFCQWLIQPPSADTITLNKVSFDITSQDQGLINEISIYDGSNTSGRLLASGSISTDIPSTLVATSGAMYIEFNGRGTSSGFDFSFESTVSSTQCDTAFPTPILDVFAVDTTQMNGATMTTYRLRVTNYLDFPDDTFEETDTGTNCSNDFSSRTTVELLDHNQNTLVSHCDFKELNDLNEISFSIPIGNCPPPYVRIQLTDLLCGRIYQSGDVSIKSYADASCFAERPCYLNLAEPYLSFGGREDYTTSGGQWTRYRIPVANWPEIPTELFAPAPDLPACGLNTNSSRSWLTIYDDQQRRLYGFCALGNNQSLSNIWVAFRQGTCPPRGVYIQILDRLCNINYTSPILDLTQHAPPGCYDYYNCGVLEKPTIALEGSSTNQVINISVENASSYSDSFFVAMPNVEPCQGSSYVSRTWLNVYDQTGEIMKTFCNLRSSNDLSLLTIEINESKCPPDAIYIELYDAECQESISSDLLSVSDLQYNCNTACPDLIIEDLSVDTFTNSSIRYSYSLRNVGIGPVNLDGATDEQYDNVSIQTFLSRDTILNNGDDISTGGTILGQSPLGYLKPGEVTKRYTFQASANIDIETHPFFIIMADWGRAVDECNEENNFRFNLINRNQDPEYDCNWDLEFMDVDMYSGSYKASNEIMSNSTVSLTMDVKYMAGDEISLYRGFEARSGSIFEAIINDCQDPQN